MRVTTDLTGLERVAKPGVEILAFTADDYPGRAARTIRLLLAALRSDYLIVHFSLPEVTLFALAFALTPFVRCRIVTLDFFIGTPRPALMPLVRWAIARVDRLLVYFRDASVFQRQFGLDTSRFEYVPFKVNKIEIIRALRTSDQGYVFSGGRSRRDFATFFQALEDLQANGLRIPVKIIAAPEHELVANGCSLSGLAVPEGVEIITDRPQPAFFNELMAGSRMVVLPILAGTTTQAGIGVYLQAMALGKCTIVSTGLGVSDVLDDGQAEIVPAGDVAALASSIRRLWTDDAERERVAERGRVYAESLGGEDDLRRSVLGALGLAA